MPSEPELAEMGKFNEELVKAGVMLAGEGLHPSRGSARVKSGDGGPSVTDGPFAEDEGARRRLLDVGREVEGGGDRVDQARAVPRPATEIEIRQVFETEDFGDELTPELREQEERARAQQGSTRTARAR